MSRPTATFTAVHAPSKREVGPFASEADAQAFVGTQPDPSEWRIMAVPT